jgi:hypothetical protein
MPTSRRTFVKQCAATSAACGLARLPFVHAAESTQASQLPILNAGDQQYTCNHAWAQLPDKYTWQTTHNVAVDSQGLVYIIHEGRLDQPDHPSIFVFDGDGKFVRAFGNQFQGGGHGLDIRKEGGDEFLYITCYQQQRSFAKLTPTGEQVWRKFAPMQTGLYAEGEDKVPRAAADNPWGRNRFMPTNYAFHPDGGFFLADGYGGYCIHRYDADANYVSTFGKPSDGEKADGTFNTPHGIWIDTRAASPSKSEPGGSSPRSADPLIVVADRANERLQWFTLAGEHVRTQPGFLLPANCDIYGDLLLVPDLFGRVTLLGADNQVIAHLGDDSARMLADKPDGKVKKQWVIRFDEKLWFPGKFVHPHDACFDAEGNIYVVDWVNSGRVTKLSKHA